MMHSESPNQGWPYNRSSKLTPGITGPVQHTRDEVDQELCDDEASNNTDWVLVIVGDGVVNQLRPEADGEDQEAQLEYEFTSWVVVLPEDLAVRLCFDFGHHLVLLKYKVEPTNSTV